MAFVPAKRPVAAAPIKCAVYDENGDVTQIEFVALYHRRSHEQVVDMQQALQNRARQLTDQEPIKRPDGSESTWAYATDMEFLRDVVAGWPGVHDAAGGALPYNTEALDALVGDYPELVVPLFNGFFEAHRGARVKN